MTSKLFDNLQSDCLVAFCVFLSTRYQSVFYLAAGFLHNCFRLFLALIFVNHDFPKNAKFSRSRSFAFLKIKGFLMVFLQDFLSYFFISSIFLDSFFLSPQCVMQNPVTE